MVLVSKLTGARIDKASRFTDWSLRPLSNKQLRYALADVTHMRDVYGRLRHRLQATDRESWLQEEMALLTDPATYDADPGKAWQRLKTRNADPRYYAVLLELAAWRERVAQKRDVPRNRILRDDAVTEIAANAPSTIEELARTRAIGGNIAKGALGSAILAAVARGLAVPDEKCPSPPMKPDLPRGIVPVVDLLKVLLKMKCEAHHVAPKLIASVKDLEQIAADDEAPVPALRGWRRELFGADALALKSGQLALSVASRRLELVPLTTAQVPGAPGRPKGRRSRS